MNDSTNLAESNFRKACTKWLVNPLKVYGFKRYKSSFVARMTTDSIFQFINLQKSAVGGKTFTANIAVRPLFIPNETLSLQPGARLGNFLNEGDLWQSYKSEEDAEESFIYANQIIIENVIPWFDRMKLTVNIVKEYDGKHSIFWGPTVGKTFDLAYMYLWINDFTNAIKMFKEARDIFSSDDKGLTQKGLGNCDKMIDLISNSSYKEIKSLLLEHERKNKIELGLKDWQACDIT